MARLPAHGKPTRPCLPPGSLEPLLVARKPAFAVEVPPCKGVDKGNGQLVRSGPPCYRCPMSEAEQPQPTVFTLGEAAKAAGVSKPSISKAIATGRMSAEKRDDGSYCIQAAELFRVYPPNRSTEDESDEPETRKDDSGLSAEVRRLRERLSLLDTERDRERQQLVEQVADLRRRLDQADQERRDKDRQLTALLTDQRPKPVEPAAVTPAPMPERPKGWRGLLHRLAG
jgi:hypothetical protein